MLAQNGLNTGNFGRIFGTSNAFSQVISVRSGWALSNRTTFGDKASKPVGYTLNSIILPVSYGAIGSLHRAIGKSNVVGDLKGTANLTGVSFGSTLIIAQISKGINLLGVAQGSCIVSNPILSGIARLTGTVRIGAQPSPEDVAQAVWGSNLIAFTIPGTAGEKLQNLNGGGGVADWTSAEKAQIRHRLGIDGTKNTPASSSPNLGIPTVAEIADAVWDELLSDHSISGSAGSILRILTSPNIASAVRSELATELARIDTAISTRLANGSYSSPPSPSAIATQVRTELAPELARIDVILSTRASQTSVNSIPINPLLANDSRLNFLDAAISSRLAIAGYTPPPSLLAIASQLRAELAIELARIDESISTRSTPAQVNTEVSNALNTYDPPTKAELDSAISAISSIDYSAIASAVWTATTRSLNVDVTLGSSEITEIANAIQAAIINEGDGQQVIDAIVNAIGNENITAISIAQAVRTNLATELARMDVNISSRASQGSVFGLY